jgi:predicted nucleotidyltransferase
MAPRLQEVTLQLRQNADELRARFGVTAMSVFGSVGRDEAHADSDVDLLVELDDRPVGMFAWIDLHHYLEALLGLHVDLGTADALKEPLRDQVLREAVRVV